VVKVVGDITSFFW